MSRKAKISVGDRFGKWTVVENPFVGTDQRRHVVVRCDCGEVREMRVRYLLSGESTSCGKVGCRATRTHGCTPRRLYRCWTDMNSRCNNPKHKFYRLYGGAGRFVCDEWKKSFVAFRDWAFSHGYNPGLTLDRIDNAKGYSPDNCRWATRRQQARNRNSNRLITFRGETLSIQEWCDRLGLRGNTVRERIRRGWPAEQALMRPPQQGIKYKEADDVL